MNYKQHLLGHEYMGGITRSAERISENAEVFTPNSIVEKMLDELPPELFRDPAKTVLDPSCGDGQFLAAVLWRRLQHMEFPIALQGIYGVELMQDNAELCRTRLLCGHSELRGVVNTNIVCADALRYHYRFDNSHPYDDESREAAAAALFNED